MTDQETIAGARQTHLASMFVVLVRGLEAGDAKAGERFASGLAHLAKANGIALKAIEDAKAKEDAAAKKA